MGIGIYRGRRKVAVVVAGVLVASLGAPLSAQATPSPEPRSAGETQEQAERPDRVSAMSTAQATSEPVEDVSARTMTSSLFAQPDGSWRVELHGGPVRAVNDEGEWAPIDTTLREADGRWAPVNVPGDLSFSADGRGAFVRYQPPREKPFGVDREVGAAGQDAAFGLVWSERLPEPVAEGSSLRYRGAVPGGDLVVTATRTGFRYDVVLEERPASEVEVLEFPVRVRGAKAIVRRGGSVAIRSEGEVVATAPAPVMWDSEATAADGSLADPGAAVEMAVEAEDGGSTLVVRPDMEFLLDPETAYPVTIDPIFMAQNYEDTWVQSTGDTSSQGSTPELRIGSSDGGATIARSFLKFPLSGLDDVEAEHVQSATLMLGVSGAAACTGGEFEVSRVTDSWSSETVTWGSQPSVTASGAATSSVAAGAAACPSIVYASLNVAGIVGNWLSGAPNQGFRVAAVDEAAGSGWRTFVALPPEGFGWATGSPLLSVVFERPPSTPSSVSVTPAVSDGSTLLTPAARPRFTAVVNDPDLGVLTPRVRIKQGSAVVVETDLEGVPAGSEAAYAPTTDLADGTYTVEWRATDATARVSEWSAPVTVVVDKVAPPQPGITCSGLTHNGWQPDGPEGTMTCTVTGGAGTDAISAYVNGAEVDLPPLVGGETAEEFPTPSGHGLFDLVVIARDAAGNSSSRTFAHTFGRGGHFAPGNTVQSAGALEVGARAQSGATGAVLRVGFTGPGYSWTTTATGVTDWAGNPWAGSVSTLGAASTTGRLWWNPRDSWIFDAYPDAGPLIRTQMCFTYAAAPTERCGAWRYVSTVSHAFGENLAVADAGPGQVALSTGEFQLAETDVEVPGYLGGLTLGRSHLSFGEQTDPAQRVFGPGWVADLQGPEEGAASVVVRDRTAANGSITLVTPVGEEFTFQHPDTFPGSQKNGIYYGVGYAAYLNAFLRIRTVSSVKYLDLHEDDGTVTTWRHVSGRWIVDTVMPPGDNTTTRYAYDAAGAVTHVIAPNPTGVTCTTTSMPRGCRVLLLSYSGSGANKRLTQIDLRIWDPKPFDFSGAPSGAAGMVTIPVAKYTYTNGLLTAAWDPRLGDGSSALKTTYTYTDTGGDIRLASLTPPGQKAWRLDYDSTKRLTAVRRAQDQAVGSGDAVWRVVYDVALAGAGLPTMTPEAVATWSQPQAPTKATAVFGPDAPGTGDHSYADISYFDDAGLLLNSAAYGAGAWQIDSQSYAHGNQLTWSLSAANRAAALAGGGATAATAYILSEHTTYNTSGTRVEEIRGPQRTAILNNGAAAALHPLVEYVYDDEAAAESVPAPGRPTPDPNQPLNLVVEERRSAVDGVGNRYDTHKLRFRYDRVVAGDGNGWDLMTPTRTSTQLGAGWSTQLVRFDADGKIIETRSPQGVATQDGAGLDTRSTLTFYYTPGAQSPHTACRNRPEWADQPCRITPAAAHESIPVTTFVGMDYLLNPTGTQETSGSMTRTTVNRYDLAGRLVRDSTSGSGFASGDSMAPARVYSYSEVHGALIAQTAGTRAIQTAYDSWGRIISQTDGLGNTATTTYDTADRVATFNDGKGTYTYTYNGLDGLGRAERRGLITKLDAGLATGPDGFNIAYTHDGEVEALQYPNGVWSHHLFNAAGAEYARNYYTQTNNPLINEVRYLDVWGKTRFNAAGALTEGYEYDGRDRLVKVASHDGTNCTTRKYTFSLDSNRTALATSVAPSCTETGATTVNHAFDAADRITGTGYTYDPLGRTLSMPAAHSQDPAGSAVTVNYFYNDLVAHITQTTNGTPSRETYTLDPAHRISTKTHIANNTLQTLQTNHYADDSDTPAWTKSEGNNGDTTWTRNVESPLGGLGMVQNSDGTSELHLTNLHGDVFATLPNTTGTTSLANYTYYSEYGQPQAFGAVPAPALRYGWLGHHMRDTAAVGGLTLMGVRLYNPTTGRFLSRDPTPGGNDNTYIYPPDPVNMEDLSGKYGLCRCGPGLQLKLSIGKKKYPRPVFKPQGAPGSVGGPTAGKPFTRTVRSDVLKKNNGKCVYCGAPATQADHIYPKSRGGNATVKNGQPTCGWCNRSKGTGRAPKNPPPGHRGRFPV